MGDYADEPADYYMRQIIEELRRHNEIQGELLLAVRQIKLMTSEVVDVIAHVGLA